MSNCKLNAASSARWRHTGSSAPLRPRLYKSEKKLKGNKTKRKKKKLSIARKRKRGQTSTGQEGKVRLSVSGCAIITAVSQEVPQTKLTVCHHYSCHLVCFLKSYAGHIVVPLAYFCQMSYDVDHNSVFFMHKQYDYVHD